MPSRSSREVQPPGVPSPAHASKALDRNGLVVGAQSPRSCRAEELLWSFDEYRRRVAAEPRSHFFRVGSADQWLFYAGFRHSADPANPDFAALEDFWREFLAACPPSRRLVLVEGEVRLVESDRGRAIGEGGEGGLVAFLANRDGIPDLLSAEPEPAKLVAEHLKRFPRGLVAYAYYARLVPVWHRFAARTSFPEFAAKSPALQVADLNWSRPTVERLHREMFGRAFDERDRDFFARITDPASSSTVINLILREDSRHRDLHMLRTLATAWQAGKHIFVVSGASHAIMQRRAVEMLVRG